jgi:hypothetical protein
MPDAFHTKLSKIFCFFKIKFSNKKLFTTGDFCIPNDHFSREKIENYDHDQL